MNRIVYQPSGPRSKGTFPMPFKKKPIMASCPPCPKCGERNNRCIDTRAADDRVRRRRHCVCGHRFTTYEVIASEHGLDYSI